MSDTITLTGTVGTDPKHATLPSGQQVTSFRFASTPRRFDANAGKWVDGETNWFSVEAWRELAVNAAASLTKGQHVIVVGRLRIRPWSDGEKSGLNVGIEAETIGPDLRFGTSAFTRADRRPPAERGADEAEPVRAESVDSDEPF